MDYRLIYDLLVQKAKERIIIPENPERHHIIPKCMGGSNKKENIVIFTTKEHFVAHHLLWKIYRTREMHFAFWCMVTKFSKNGIRNYNVNSATYALAKAEQSKRMSGENNPNANGRSEESKRKSSIALKGKSCWCKGKNHSSATIEKMRESAKNRLPDTEETKLKKSKSHQGVKKGPSPLKGKPAKPYNEKYIAICPHCNKQGIEWNMKRYHFDNCKFKEKENLR